MAHRMWHTAASPATLGSVSRMSRILEVFADVGCPFTHVGLRQFVEARSVSGRDDVRLVVRAWPLEIVNGEPLAASHVAREVEALRGSVAAHLFSGFDPARYPGSTLPAMALAADAYRKGLDVGEAVSLELRDRLFERGENVAEPGVLAEVAAAHGLPSPDPSPDPTAVLSDYEEGTRRGVMGSPHFFAAGQGFFCPALHIEQRAGRFEVTATPERFDELLAVVFAPS